MNTTSANRIGIHQHHRSSHMSHLLAVAAAALITGCTGNPAAPSTKGWATWSKLPTPVYSGQYMIDGDPCVIKDGSIYRMLFTGYDPVKGAIHAGPVLCEAVSTDGLHWKRVFTALDHEVEGKILPTDAGTWDETHETCFMMRAGNEYRLYYSGYVERGGFARSFPVSLGLARSIDGITFTKHAGPAMTNTPDGFDHDGIVSPTIVEHGGSYYMIYTAYNYYGSNASGAVLAGAVSTDGSNWNKHPVAVLSPDSRYPWMAKAPAEPELIKGPDGWFYLFVSGVTSNDTMAIGIMRSHNPFGPWDINPEPILTSSPGCFDAKTIVAPSVLIENGIVRMWFAGFDYANHIQIGYAAAYWPLFVP
ncbi:MAG: hypothetical protein HZC28_04965 [Spirochaetes bacterium]|nr:hypothetical protein [Spirochaetota bacterium]